MGFTRYAAVDENYAFPTPVREAIVASAEMQTALASAGGPTRYFYPEDFGAKGDGVTDDWAAIDAAFDAALAAGGGDVSLGSGIFAISQPISNGSTGYQHIHFHGDGQQATRIKALGNFAPISGAWFEAKISDLILDANLKGSPAMAVHLDKTIVDNVQMFGWTDFAMKLNDGTFGDLGLLNRIQRCNIDQNTGYGIWTSYRFIDSWITENNIGSTLANISVEGGPLRIIGNHMNGAPEINLELRGNRRITVVANIMEGARKQAIVYNMPPWLTAEDLAQIQIVGNALSNGSKASPGAYSAIEIIGRSETAHARGFSITGNIIACEDAGSGWEYAVKGTYAQSVSVVGNQWPTGHLNQYATSFSGSLEVEVLGNHGDNGPQTEVGGTAHTRITDITGLRAELDARPALGTDGKLPSSVLPAVITVNPTPVNSQAAQLALPADVGDMAIRTDVNRTFILYALPASTLSNWLEILTPADGIVSINGDYGPNITGIFTDAKQQAFADALAIDRAAKNTELQTLIGQRELSSNKKTDGTLGGSAPSDVFFPTQKAVQAYVAANNAANYGLRTSNVVTSAAGLTPDPNLYSEHAFTALASSLTVANTVAYPTGTTFLLSIKDDGTARSLTFGSGYVGLKDALPTTTVPGKVLLAVFRYSASRSRWELLLLNQEA